MKLSIITINYNNRDGLQKTIDSVMSQTWRDFEWVIIDGGSTDGSKELIEETATDQSSNITFWCSESDNGVYNAMNKGVSVANGIYLHFLNSGDVLHDRESLSLAFKSDFTEDIIYGNVNFVSKQKEEIFVYPDDLSIHYFIYRSLGHPSTFIKAKLLKENPYREDFKIVSDWHNFFKWYLEGKSFRHINITISNFDTTGISTNSKSLLAEESVKVYKELLSNSEQWIEESKKMQREHEFLMTSEMQLASRIIMRGGKRKRLLYLIMKLLRP